MNLLLDKVVPDFISIKNSEIWGNKISIQPGVHLHIVAPSGSGKTSLMHFIYGIRKDYSGDILWNEKNLKSFSDEQIATYRQKEISIIFQDLRLFPTESAFENIEIKRKLNPFVTEQQVIDMARRLGIENKLSQSAQTCSYGEQQRIAIIRALTQPFKFLLLDEPFSHLDEVNRSKAADLIYEQCERRNAAMIFADLKKLDFFSNEKVLYL